MAIFKKHPDNPLLGAANFPDDIMYAFNPGAVSHADETILMVDAATTATPIVFWLARSRDGVRFSPDPTPPDWPMPAAGPEDCVYDPRITPIDGGYVIMYASQAPGRGVRTGVVRTRDFRRFERVEQEECGRNNRNSVLFPERIGGRYVRLDRPMGDDEFEPSDMCLSWSEDLSRWRDTKVLMKTRPGCWDSHKVGGGAVPIRTDEGWLILYHGVDRTCNGFIYRMGAALLDLDDPSRVVARGVMPVLWPERDYEMRGRVMNVTFACNALVDADGAVRVYYGAADTCIGLATSSLPELVAACRAQNTTARRFFHGAAPAPRRRAEAAVAVDAY